jgi:hypothetical protein
MLNRHRYRSHKPAPRSPRAGEVVYFVRAGNAIKIGRTTNLPGRLKALATASAVPLELLAAVPGGRELEARLHHRWRHLHLRGEWFRADEALVSRSAAGCKPTPRRPPAIASSGPRPSAPNSSPWGSARCPASAPSPACSSATA